MAGLHADRLGKSVCHGAMSEGAEKPALAVHMEIARGPNRWRAYVAGKNCIFCRQLIEDLGYILGMNRRAAPLARREIIQALTCILIVAQTSVEIGSIGLALEQRS